ncbi:type II toxin-antitoxin system RelE/ParE family toxin [Limnohabitans sp.]|uniref:type II toxin-antitoxin system RelE/ParE family toxin n=1 Tax=Limnohabitans sp. TaxID=1907725 RepID=UPI00333FB77B
MSEIAQVFVTKPFARWMRKSRVTHLDILGAAEEMVQGLIDANLGGHLVKKRVALRGRGKSAGARTIVATKFEQRWIFLFGFEKNERSNIDASELKVLQELAASLLDLDQQAIAVAVGAGQLFQLQGEE